MGLSLLVDMEEAGAMVVIDAAQLGAAPGSIKTFQGAEMEHFLGTRSRNPHDIGLDDMLDGLRLRGAVPDQRALVGIQPAHLGIGEEMTAEVAEAVPAAVEAVFGLAALGRRV